MTEYDSCGSIKGQEAGGVTDGSFPNPGLCYKPRFYMKMDRWMRRVLSDEEVMKKMLQIQSMKINL